MNILLTGASGFLGSKILIKLLVKGYNIFITTRNSSNLSKIEPHLKKVTNYNTDKISLGKIFSSQNFDVIIHTATNYGRKSYEKDLSQLAETNIFFPIKILEYSIKNNTKAFLNTDTLLYKKINQYALSKNHFLDWSKYFSSYLKIINIKFDFIYGVDDDKSKFFPWLINELSLGTPIIPLTRGTQLRDFLFVEDAADVYLAILNNLQSLNQYFEIEVGYGNSMRLKDFIHVMLNEFSKFKKINSKLEFGSIKYREHEKMNCTPDTSYLNSIGWRPKYSLQQGVKKTITEIFSDCDRKSYI